MKSVKVTDYMSRNLVTLHPRTNVVEALATILDHRITGAPVVDDDGRLVGMLAEVDLLSVVIQDSYYDQNMGIVADYMSTQVETVDPDTDIYSLAGRFLNEHHRRYPVVEDGELVGQISRRDVLQAFHDFLAHVKS